MRPYRTVDATVICPVESVGKVVELCIDRRGAQLEHTFLDESRVMLRYRMPLGEVGPGTLRRDPACVRRYQA